MAGESAAIGTRIRQLREARGWSLRQVSGKLAKLNVKISHVALGDLERGDVENPGVLTIVGIARLFGVPVGQVLGLPVGDLPDYVSEEEWPSIIEFTRGYSALRPEDRVEAWRHIGLFFQAKNVEVKLPTQS